MNSKQIDDKIRYEGSVRNMEMLIAYIDALIIMYHAPKLQFWDLIKEDQVKLIELHVGSSSDDITGKKLVYIKKHISNIQSLISQRGVYWEPLLITEETNNE